MESAMSIEKALLGKARSHMLAAKAQALVQYEASKGCLPDILPQPVALEPSYGLIPGNERAAMRAPFCHWEYEEPPIEDELIRLQIWTSPEQKCDWVRSELLLKQLSHVQRRVVLELVGNAERIQLQMLCHRDDWPIVMAAFNGQFEQCRLSDHQADMLRGFPLEFWEQAVFRDFCSPPPYAHLFTRPDELRRSPYTTLIAVLTRIPAPAIGIYQVVFEPVQPTHDWHRNVQALLDLEYTIKLLGGLAHPRQFAQQAPSGDLRQMSADVEVKSTVTNRSLPGPSASAW